VLVRSGEKVTVEIPIMVTGDIAPDGLLDQQLIQIRLEVEATHIPQGVEVDVEGMEVGASIHASDLKLPRGASLQVEPETLVLHVIPAPTAEQMEAEIAIPETVPAAPEAVAEGGAEAAPAGEQSA
jgi:large subunit ribosomal protein L25